MADESSEPVYFLVVDDLEDNILVMEMLLRRQPVTVLKARSGHEALELLLVHDVALALVDVQMPGMDGFELAELMRGSERTRHVPIIFVTAGSHGPGRLFDGYDAGAVDFLFKPLDPHILRNKTATFYDLHRQKQQLASQLARLRESEEFVARMIEASQDCIGVVDLDGRVVSIHEGVPSRLLGSAPNGVAGTPWLSLWSVESRARAEQVLAGARGGTAGRFVAQGTSDGLRWWDVAVTPIHDARGVVEKLLTVARDVTAEREAEHAREEVTRELGETLRFNEIFIAAISHDLRSPLNAIVMGSDLLMLQLTDALALRAAEKVRSSGLRMSRMIDDLFDLARARLSGGIPLELRDVELAELARGVVDEHTATHPERSIEMDREGELTARWDGDRVQQVLSNLVSNALRHGRPEEPVHIHLDGTRADDVAFSVHNAGPIEPRVLERIFEPFRKGDEERSRTAGLGLGLYIVEQIVTTHGGRVRVDSSSAAGTTFLVTLPRNARGDSGARTSDCCLREAG